MNIVAASPTCPIDTITPAGISVDLAAHGLGPDEVTAVQAFLTTYATRRRTIPPASKSRWNYAGQVVRAWAATALPGDPAPMPDFAPGRRTLDPGAVLGMASIAGAPITEGAIRRAFNEMQRESDEAALPLELLAAIMPCDYWPAWAQFICQQPRITIARMDAYLASYSRGKKHQTAVKMREAIRRVLDDFVSLQGHSCGLFSQWGDESVPGRPQLTIPEGLDRAPTRSGNPEVRELRLAVQGLRDELRSALAKATRQEVEPGGELEAARNLSRSALKRNPRIFTAARDWVALHALWTTQSRVDSTLRLRAGDLSVARTGAGKMPTIHHRPRKSHPEDWKSPKPLSALAHYPFLVLEAIRETAAAGPIQEAWPLIPGKLDDQSVAFTYAQAHALFAGYCRKADGRDCPLHEIEAAIQREAASAAAEGRAPVTKGPFTVVNHKGRHKRIWLEAPPHSCSQRDAHAIYVGVRRGLLPMDGNPYGGWTPHSLRRTGSQSLGSPRVLAHLADRNVSIPAEHLSEILQDHTELSGTTGVSAVYKLPPDQRHRIAAVAIDCLAEMLYGRLGARLVPDRDRHRQQQELLKGARSKQANNIEKRRELRERLSAGRITETQYRVAADELFDENGQLAETIAMLRAEVEGLQQGDRRRWIAAPDEWTEEQCAYARDLSTVSGGDRQDGPPDHIRDALARERQREWVTLNEVSKVAGLSAKQIRAWVNPDPAKRVRPAGTPPFITADPPVVELGSARNRRIIPIEAINPAWLDEVPARRQLLERFLAEWPVEDKWSNYRRKRHDIPDALREELEQFAALERAVCDP